MYVFYWAEKEFQCVDNTLICIGNSRCSRERDENYLPQNTQKSEEKYGCAGRNAVAAFAFRFYEEIE